jgi:hypothetical protein
MNKDKKNISKADIRNYFLSESNLISSDINDASLILEDEKLDIDMLTNQGLSFVNGLFDKCDKELIEFDKFNWATLKKKISKTGLPSNFLEKKIIPQDIQNKINTQYPSKASIKELLIYLNLVFGWSYNKLMNEEELVVSPLPMEEAFFKRQNNSNIHQIRAYSHYAYFIAKTIKKACEDIPLSDYPTNLDEFRELIVDQEKSITLESVIDGIWKLGICIIPLDDSGIFHGASWNIQGRHIIVVKQNTKSQAKWLFDLLHEMYHVFVHLDKMNSSVIEEVNPGVILSNSSTEELEANSFANKLIFGDKAEILAQKCVDLAGNDIRLLKHSVKQIAEEESIRVDFLSNYLAYRLDSEGQNWWGTANSLQIIEPDPIEYAKGILKSKLNYNHLNTIESNMLSMAID